MGTQNMVICESWKSHDQQVRAASNTERNPSRRREIILNGNTATTGRKSSPIANDTSMHISTFKNSVENFLTQFYT